MLEWISSILELSSQDNLLGVLGVLGVLGDDTTGLKLAVFLSMV